MLRHVHRALQIVVVSCSMFQMRDCCTLADMYRLHWVSESVRSCVSCWRNTRIGSGIFLSVTIFRCNMWIFQIFTWNFCCYRFDSSVVETPPVNWTHSINCSNNLIWWCWVENLAPVWAVWDIGGDYCAAAKPFCSLFNYFSEQK